MTEKFGQRCGEPQGQFVVGRYEVNKGPQWKKDHVEQDNKQSGNGSSLVPALVKALMQNRVQHEL